MRYVCLSVVFAASDKMSHFLCFAKLTDSVQEVVIIVSKEWAIVT
ncbi:hypothetical protein ACLKMH_19225 [Psychromonas sp. KJ10-10]